MNRSTLLEQVVKRKKGVIVSPLVDTLGNIISLSSWGVERLPEYIWLALILEEKGRADGIKICVEILREIIAFCPNMSDVKMSSILESSASIQETIFEIVCKHVKKDILSPLSLVIDETVSRHFFRNFYLPLNSVQKRTEKLQAVTKKYYNQSSNEATDLRYLALINPILTGELMCPKDSLIYQSLLYYGTTDHSNEIMQMYRSIIRSTEGALNGVHDKNKSAFVEMFWNKMRNITDNVLYALYYKKNESEMDYQDFIKKTKESLNYLNIENKGRATTDDAFVVLTGSLSYAMKLFEEVINHDLSNTLIGRQSVRTIIEIYIMMKYLAETEKTKPAIWSQYKAYGIGKYKLILLKKREKMGSLITHINSKILEVLVNEPQWEEFTDIDLKYFDDVKIRDKAIKVNEKDLYDVAYDYDSNFAHGLWGAIRESSMLCSDNVFYHFSPVADAMFKQNLPDVTADCFACLVKLIVFVNDRYTFPEWYIKFIEEVRNCVNIKVN